MKITFFQPHPVLSDSVEIFTCFIILVTFSSVEVQPGSGEITFFQPRPNLSDSVEIFTGFIILVTFSSVEVQLGSGETQ